MTKRSFLPTYAEIEALERKLSDADPPLDPEALARIEKFKESLRKHGRKLRYVPLLGSGYALLSILDWPGPWWSTVIAAVAFGGAGLLWGERLALVRYRQLLERELLPSDEPMQLASSSTDGAVAVPALGGSRRVHAANAASAEKRGPDDAADE
jgi:hypothetical protein